MKRSDQATSRTLSRRSRRTLAAIALGMLTIVGTSATLAHAQQTPPATTTKDGKPIFTPPAPPAGRSDMPWIPMAVTILLVGLVAGVNFIPSKRGHQD